MKTKLSKSLVFSFFLIGIILGIVLLDAGVIHLPVVNLSQPDEPANVEQAENSQPVVQVQPKKVEPAVSSAEPAEEIPAEPPVKELPQPVTEPIICDQEQARAVRKKAREIAVITDDNGVLIVNMGRGWIYYSPGIKRSFVESFSTSDTCLHGRQRTIIFYFRGKQVATVDIRGGIEFK